MIRSVFPKFRKNSQCPEQLAEPLDKLKSKVMKPTDLPIQIRTQGPISYR